MSSTGTRADYAVSHGNTPEALYRGHGIRDGVFDDADQRVIDTKELHDLVIVGGGMAGLGAAHQAMMPSI